MSTLFISDLHLSEQEPAITAGFLRFLHEDAPGADALYILGDLFDAWIGDDDPAPLHGIVAQALKTLSDGGVPCYFTHGNRDFLLGRRFARQSGLRLLATETVIDLYGRRTLLLHGDTLCTDDHAYQHFRRKVHHPLIQRLFLWLPLSFRLRIAARMRAASQQANQHKSMAIMDVNADEVLTRLRRHQATLMIHGHTHRPAIHTIDQADVQAERAVLGAWHQEGSLLRVTADDARLISFPL
ncbi:UDP-2,3-diacylglucosamine diphosphatase [Dickeya chrysanthemi]|uniref:UDP-2,3-diacylglucosamine diphosphatase n=1 Tax=Dickeya chrysanthemi TaxID=556 RepID=UPI0003A7EB6A|nr:UDP-2,3-diacylglucosamine diphosphatase [Dickeya chrysanthemi]MBX9446049.1 UDP-2,3-diacylglucosamine diphosphatase [Dickeya chrysanthemi]MCA7008240.1 UDP-2,3-diacylglucosamine diphosphatase [Dickeya chrysanthemi]